MTGNLSIHILFITDLKNPCKYLIFTPHSLGRGDNFVPFFLCTKMNLKQILIDKVNQKFQEEGFEDCFLIEIEVLLNNRYKVFIDSDSGVTARKCTKISRHLESYLDENDKIADKYTLEVSSPGVERPLKLPRQYQKNVGRTLKLALSDGRSGRFDLLEANAEKITAMPTVSKKARKKMKTELEPIEIPYDGIDKAIVCISFS